MLKRRRITLKDIAERAGVSVVSVSKALNGKPDISEHTRSRVLAIADELGYSPNHLARSLRMEKTLSIGVIVTNIANPFFPPIIKAIEKRARQDRFSLILASSGSNYEQEMESIKVMVSKRVDGILITPVGNRQENVELLLNCGIPSISIARAFRGIDMNSIIFDDYECGHKATQYLTDKGHSRILFIDGPPDSLSSANRLLGYRAALDENCLAYDSQLVKHAPDALMDSAYSLMHRVLRSSVDFSAVLCYDDFFALAVIKALNESRTKVPDEVAVMGINGIEFGGLVVPSLTTLELPLEQLGAVACENLIRHIEEGPPHPYQLVLQPQEIRIGGSA